ncbi:MAG TPA: elongation factor Ts [Planctomycetia bacterium]|nr:elongation factor Ts [Planctomycetia bacterium]
MATATPAQAVKELRELTGLGMMECKSLLTEAGNDLEAAKKLAAQRGKDRAAKLADRVGTEGTIGSYIHVNNRVGVMVELNCNTDFVARGTEFTALAREIAMHVAAMAPLVVRREELDAELVASVRANIRAELGDVAKKPPEMVEKIVDGKMAAWFEERVLLDQKWVKDSGKTIRQLIEDKVATIKENITIRRFVRYEVGEGAAPAAEG